MNRISIALAIACGLLTPAANAAPPAAYAVCAACHPADGMTGLGPSIQGVYGRKAGTGRRFMYSAALRKSDMIWDDKSLDAFIADPQKAIPGTLMPFAGVADAKQRAEIIEYLKTGK